MRGKLETAARLIFTKENRRMPMMTQEEANQRAAEIKEMVVQLKDALDDALKRGMIVDFNISRPNDESPSNLTFSAKLKLAL